MSTLVNLVKIIMGRRSRLEILASILEAISEGIRKPTRIMYSTNLSWLPTQRYLTLLVERGLLNESKYKRRKVYDVTEAGKRFLHHLDQARAELAEVAVERLETLEVKEIAGLTRS